MSGCSLVAAGLPSLIGTAIPTFSYDPSRHPLGSGDQFGIQMSYMSGTSTCYQGTKPTFTPIISNPFLLYARTCSYVTAGSPATYTAINCNADLANWINAGAYTIDNTPFLLNLFANTPRPFTATFGGQPAPSTIATTTVLVTSTATSTVIAPIQPAAITTVTSALATNTFTNTETVRFPVTSPFVQTITSCLTPLSSVAPIVPVSSPLVVPSLLPPILPPLLSPILPVSSPTIVPISSPLVVPSLLPPVVPVSSPLVVPSSLPTVPSSLPIVPSSLPIVPISSPLVVPSSLPIVPSSLPIVPSSLPIVPISSPLVVPSSLPIVPISSPLVVPSSLPIVPSSLPVVPSSLPTVPSSLPIVPSSLPIVPSSLPIVPISSPLVVPSSLPIVPSSLPVVPSSLPVVPSSLPTVPSSLPIVPSSLPIVPSSPLTSASPAPSVSGLSCPASDGATFRTPQGNFVVECFIDRFNNDIGIAPNNPATYEQCVQACASTTGCQAVSYLPNGPCYLKNGLGAPNPNSNVWGARVASVSVPISSSSLSSTSSARSSSPAVATTTVVSTTVVTTSSSSRFAASPTASVSCPGSNGATVIANGQQYLVECGSDYTGADIPGPMSPTFPGSYERCVADCASTAGCVAVSYVMGGHCYLKNAVSGVRTNANIIGGRLIGSVSTSAVATSSTQVISAAPAPGPSTVTVTTTISNTAYQCACTSASIFSSSSSAPAPRPTSPPVTCPGSNGSTFMTSCGALYAVECSVDRFGNDLQNGLVYTDTYEQCLQACDTTTGCVAVSWVTGKPGQCYMKGSSGAIQNNSNIIGGRKLSGCSTLKLHRKRVAVAAPKQKLAKRAGFFGPDFTFTQDRVTATATATVTTTVSTTSTPILGTATQTVFAIASATVTITTSVPTIVYNIVNVTTCPIAIPTL